MLLVLLALHGVVALAPPPPLDFDALLTKAKAGEPVDLGELRRAYVGSDAAVRVLGARREVRDLRAKMFDAIERGDGEAVLAAAELVLAKSPLDLHGHKARRQACELLKRDACAQQSRAIGMGMLKWIVAQGDGKTCATGWPVVTIDDEYFMLRMNGDRFLSQKLEQGERGVCDAMTVRDESGAEQVRYFKVDAVFEIQARAMGAR